MKTELRRLTREHASALKRYHIAARAATAAGERLAELERWHNTQRPAYAADSKVMLRAALALEAAQGESCSARFTAQEAFDNLWKAHGAVAAESNAIAARAAAADKAAADKAAADKAADKAAADSDPKGYARAQQKHAAALAAFHDSERAHAVLRAGCRIQAAAGEAGSPLAADIITVMAVLKGEYLRRVHLAKRAAGAATRAKMRANRGCKTGVTS